MFFGLNFFGSFFCVVLFVLGRRALSPWIAEIVMNVSRMMCPMARAISKLLDRMYEINEFMDDQWRAKNRADVTIASKGRSIRILFLSTEKSRLRSLL